MCCMSHRVDLDALEQTRRALVVSNKMVSAKRLEKALAELRELRERDALATVYELKRATVRCVPTRDGDEHEWEVDRDNGPTTAYPTVEQALAAARKWEAEHA